VSELSSQYEWNVLVNYPSKKITVMTNILKNEKPEGTGLLCHSKGYLLVENEYIEDKQCTELVFLRLRSPEMDLLSARELEVELKKLPFPLNIRPEYEEVLLTLNEDAEFRFYTFDGREILMCTSSGGQGSLCIVTFE
jgi:hypothetical protein